MAKIIIEDQNESLVPGDQHQAEDREAFEAVPIIQALPQDFKIASEFELVGDDEEKIVGTNNLMNIAWLARGLELSKAVARIVTPQGLGTGFLIGNDLLLTNNHVLPDAETASKSKAEFNYQKDWSGKQAPVEHFTFDSKRFITNKALDYTIVKVNGNPGQKYGFIQLDAKNKAKVNDYVSIIQHPAGGLKQVALTDNKITAVFGNVVQYTTDTEPGSSGSPVFDQNWNLVALHHAGGMLEGPDGKKWFCNEGIQVQKIIQDARNFLGVSDPSTELSFKTIWKVAKKAISYFRDNQEAMTIENLKPYAEQLLKEHPELIPALEYWAQNGQAPDQLQTESADSDNTQEIVPVLVIGAGLAVGAGIRHLGNRFGRRESTDGDFAVAVEVPQEVAAIISEHQNSERLPHQVFLDVYRKLRANLRICLPLAKNFMPQKKESFESDTQEAIPVLAAVFLASVVAGAKAYGSH